MPMTRLGFVLDRLLDRAVGVLLAAYRRVVESLDWTAENEAEMNDVYDRFERSARAGR